MTQDDHTCADDSPRDWGSTAGYWRCWTYSSRQEQEIIEWLAANGIYHDQAQLSFDYTNCMELTIFDPSAAALFVLTYGDVLQRVQRHA